LHTQPSVSAEVAEAVQFQNGTEVVEVVPVYANSGLTFTPDGYHVVLGRLKQDLLMEMKSILSCTFEITQTFSSKFMWEKQLSTRTTKKTPKWFILT
jgi:copper(I)-binding protein